MRRITTAALASSVLLAVACAAEAATGSADGPEPEPAPMAGNPLLQPSPLPYQLPPFDRIEDGHFLPAFEAGMAQHREEIEAIANDPAPPTFENTIVAMERAGATLNRTSAVFYNLTASNTNPTLDEVQSEIAPRLSEHRDSIFLNPALFERVRTLYERRQALELDAEAERLLERYYTEFVRAGALLDEAHQARLRELNKRLSTLTTEFRQRVLKATNAHAVVVDDVASLSGLSEQQIAVAAEAARERGLKDRYVIALLNTTTQPVLAELEDRDLRRRIFETSTSRGIDGEHATTELVAEIVRIRAERAKLLGYPTHAHYVLEDETAKTPKAVNDLLAELAPPALANARREAARIQTLIDAEAKAAGAEPFTIQPWDWQYYAERVRRAEYAYDESEVRPYFEYDNVLEKGVLFAAERLYGLRFEERHDLPVYQKDVRVFEVFDHDGSPLGLFLVDWFARPNKRGGAWMNSFVDQSHLLGTRAVVVNNLNIPPPPEGQPALLTFDEVTTAFHEFGHALHGLFSDVRYPTLSGTNVPRDFVEYPSQYNEMWATDPTVLANYARHYRTGEKMPDALLAKVIEARKFNQGYATTEYLAAAMLDQAWHQRPLGETPGPADVIAFEREALERAGLDYYAVPPRYRSTYFSHVFANPVGYSAGYYAYIWSEVLARDTEHWFDTHGGLERKNGDHFRKTVLSRGFTEDAMDLFRAFKGAEPDIEPLLRARGLVPEDTARGTAD
ncbi:MAG TPA: M3 family metallopeptidase [Pseudomonadales bacterium]